MLTMLTERDGVFSPPERRGKSMKQTVAVMAIILAFCSLQNDSTNAPYTYPMTKSGTMLSSTAFGDGVMTSGS